MAASHTEDGKAYVFGEGVYVGPARPKNGTLTPFGPITDDHFPAEWQNPKIELDNGKVVWGCQCWWGPVEQVKKRIAGLEVVLIDPPELQGGGPQ